MKRILTIQDISCIGRCSLTVALPILSVMGHETVILPTAVLSAHTQFSHVTFRDLTSDLPAIAHHWKQEKFTFDAIYTGYLGSAEQIRIVKDYFRDFSRPSTFRIVDPVMGDNGKLYTGFDESFAAQMTGLCAEADIILPNLTEAAYMLKLPCQKNGYSESDIQDILRRLCALGAKRAVLTGVSFHETELGAMSYDSVTDTFDAYFSEKIPVSYHGTGDCFASCLSGAILQGKTMAEALRLSVDFIVEGLRLTMADPDRRDYGINFEEALPLLIHRKQNTSLHISS
ncbi:MAG: pyridoxamine kinase [Lachnospiraceae bacterium]|nr:pyridoxamine kinase [Lachnospiraceae bacterium]